MKTSATRAVQCSAVVMAVGLMATACGGSGGDDAAQKNPEFKGRGPIKYVAGKDAGGSVQKVIDKWNKAHPKEKVTFVELPTDADAQRQQMIQNAQTKSDAYSVLSLDVVWTSEFAAHQWIDKLPEDKFPLDKMMKPVVETGKYRGGQYSIPHASDGGLLYYRKDLLKKAGIDKAPVTWDEMRKACDKVQKLPEGKDMDCYAGQHQKYEGLTVNFSEAVNSAGGEVLDSKGKPNLDTPEAKKGLDFLAKSVKDKTIPKEATTYQEEQCRQAFQGVDLIFLRNWPYVHSLASKKDGSSKVAGKFDVAPLPGLKGPGTSSLGGHNVALSSSAKNKATAIDFMKFFTSEEKARFALEEASLAPPYESLYTDKAMVKKFPYLPTLKKSILSAEPRPRVVNYGDASSAIQKEAYAAMTGTKSSAEALKDLQKALKKPTAQQ